MSDDADAAAGPRWQTQCGIGVALLLVAAALWFDAGRLPPAPSVGVGPSAALRLIGVLVAALGLAHFVSAWRARQAGLVEARDRGNHTSLGIVLAALVGQIVLLEIGGGFIISSVWLFAADGARLRRAHRAEAARHRRGDLVRGLPVLHQGAVAGAARGAARAAAGLGLPQVPPWKSSNRCCTG